MFKDYKNGLIIFSLFLILILSLGSISASEDLDNQLEDVDSSIDDDIGIADEINSNNEINDNDDNIETNIDENILSEEDPSNTITLNGGTFEDIQTAVNDASDGDTIELNGTFESTGNLIGVDKNLTFQGLQDAVLDGKKSSGIFNTNYKNVIFKDITFVNGKANEGGAIYGACTIINCTFKNNVADSRGGAIYDASAVNCTFENNKAQDIYASEGGGAMFGGSALNCTFIDNSANMGAAIRQGSAENCTFINNSGAIWGGSVLNCTFINNSANYGGGISQGTAENCTFIGNRNVLYSSTATNCTFIGNDVDYTASDNNFINCYLVNNTGYKLRSYSFNSTFDNTSFGGEAVNCTFMNYHGDTSVMIGSATNCTFINNSAKRGGALRGSAVNCTFENNSAEYGAAIYLLTENDEGNEDTCTDCTFINNVGTVIEGDVVREVYAYLQCHDITTAYNGGDKFTFKYFDYQGNLISKGKVLIKSSNLNRTVDIKDGNLTFTLDGFAPGSNIDFIYLDYVEYLDCPTLYRESYMSLFEVTIKKATPKLVASAVTTVYNGGKYLTATFKDAKGKVIKNAKITIKINGKTYAKTTNANGQVKLSTNGLAPKTYTATIAYAGDKYYNKVTKSVKVTVKKATPKLTAAAKTFKVAKKTKSYAVTFKTNQNKAFKNVKLSLKVNGKTYAVKTNAKGIAIFKITNLKKKGKFKAVATFAGSKYFNKVSKTATITVK